MTTSEKLTIRFACIKSLCSFSFMRTFNSLKCDIVINLNTVATFTLLCVLFPAIPSSSSITASPHLVYVVIYTLRVQMERTDVSKVFRRIRPSNVGLSVFLKYSHYQTQNTLYEKCNYTLDMILVW